ncbi:MAG TPA: response regulator [Bryobacteraceae bacterium]
MTHQREKRPYQILLAEDSPADVGLIRMVLRDENLDHVLRVATDGAEAITFIRESDKNSKAPGFDLLLLDMHLPKHDGEEILNCLRSTGRHGHTPVVVLSSSDAPADRKRALKQAALVYFRKPSDFEEFAELGTIIRNILIGRPPTSPQPPATDGETV